MKARMRWATRRSWVVRLSSGFGLGLNGVPWREEMRRSAKENMWEACGHRAMWSMENEARLQRGQIRPSWLPV